MVSHLLPLNENVAPKFTNVYIKLQFFKMHSDGAQDVFCNIVVLKIFTIKIDASAKHVIIRGLYDLTRNFFNDSVNDVKTGGAHAAADISGVVGILSGNLGHGSYFLSVVYGIIIPENIIEVNRFFC